MSAVMRSPERNEMLVPLCELKLSGTGAKAGTFSGYGSVFGNVDSYGDVIANGAFASTLKDWESRGKYPPMLLQHGGWGVNNTDLMPVGEWTKMAEDEHGLYVEGRLFALDTELGRYIHEGLTSGVLDGLSIGYQPIKVKFAESEEEPDRTLLEVKLWELSIVTWPANSEARILEAKRFQSRDIEHALRPIVGRQRAKHFASVLTSLSRDDVSAKPTAAISAQRDVGEKDEIAEILRAAQNRMETRFVASVKAAL